MACSTAYGSILRAAFARVSAALAAWRRRSRDRAVLHRMSRRQLDDLPLAWQDMIRIRGK